MTTKINGRTPEEIKRGLECSHTKHCIFKSCPYYAQNEELSACIDQSRADALFLINQLLEDKKQLERERDAAVETLKHYAACNDCKHFIEVNCNERSDFFACFVACGEQKCICGNCKCGSNWQWRGVQEVEGW